MHGVTSRLASSELYLMNFSSVNMYCVASCAVSCAAIYFVLAAFRNGLSSQGKVFSSHLLEVALDDLSKLGFDPGDDSRSFHFYSD